MRYFLGLLIAGAMFLFLSIVAHDASAQIEAHCKSNWISRSCSSYPTPNSECNDPLPNGIMVQDNGQHSTYGWEKMYCNGSCNGYTNFVGYYNDKCNYMANACPSGQSWKYNGINFSCQSDSVPTPQDCGITGFPVWNGTGYTCEANFNTPCPAGTINGQYSLPGYDPRPYCADANPPASSSPSVSSAASSGGQNSSAAQSSTNNSDGSGGDSSSGSGGSSASSNGNGSGGGSSGSASSMGQGGSASSVGAGDCDPTSDDYALCIGFTEEVGDNEAHEIIDGVTGEAQDLLDGVYDDLESDIDEFTGIDSQFADAPSALEQAVMGFLPSPASCTPFSFTFLGKTQQMPCEKFQDFRLIFGWFLTICAAVYIWQITTKPVER